MKRVVVTGMGVVTPIGNDIGSFTDGLRSGKVGIKPIDFIDEEYKVKVAATCDIDIDSYFDGKEQKRTSRFMQLGMIAANEAIDNADLKNCPYEKERIGVVVGSGVGGIINFEKEAKKDTLRQVSAYCIPMLVLNMLPGAIAIKYGFKGHCEAVTSACSTGNHAIGRGADLIRLGKLDAVIVGGSESTMGGTEIAGFGNMRALSTSEDINRASIPFDKERGGFVMGEGAGILVLEEYEKALSRGANIICELVGFGSTCDAYHLTAPSPNGEGAARAMKLAIEEAGIDKADIGYINAHGTGTQMNDSIETLAIKTVFDNACPPISSIKSMIGHLLGAAGAVEAIACIVAMKEGFLPPTVNYKVWDENCDLDVVPNVAREYKTSCVMSNSFGFGGHNTALIFKEMDK